MTEALSASESVHVPTGPGEGGVGGMKPGWGASPWQSLGTGTNGLQIPGHQLAALLGRLALPPGEAPAGSPPSGGEGRARDLESSGSRALRRGGRSLPGPSPASSGQGWQSRYVGPLPNTSLLRTPLSLTSRSSRGMMGES